MQKLWVCLCMGQIQGVGGGGGGGGGGAGGGGWGGMKFLQKSNVHIYSCLGRAGRRPHVRPHVSHSSFCQNINI